MIVLDSSALIAIAKGEALANKCMRAIVSSDHRLISAATLTEVQIVAAKKKLTARLDELLGFSNPTVIVVDEQTAVQAVLAYRQWGKGFHPAKLNFGDCFAYALAKSRNCPLLFIGDDFSQTDVLKAI